MECNRRIFMCVVLIFCFGENVFTSKISSSVSSNKNYGKPRSKDVLETYNNCSGLKVFFFLNHILFSGNIF